MDGQMSLFDMPGCMDKITVINGNDRTITLDSALKCYKSELKSVDQLTVNELFSGYSILKAITFSYSLDFIEELAQHFDYAEIILGADFMVRRDEGMNAVLEEVLTNAQHSLRLIKKHARLIEMMRAGNLVIRVPRLVLDHRKIYLLKADNGMTRVIKSSANMTHMSWNNSHMETYEYDDTSLCYDEYCRDFETIWQESEELPYSVVSSKKNDDLVNDNAIIKGVKDKDKVTIFKEEDDVALTKYVIDHAKLREEFKSLIGNVTSKATGNLFELTPRIVEKLKLNKQKEAQKKTRLDEVTKTYPALSFNYEEKSAFINGNKINLTPSEDEVRNDIDLLLQMFQNYADFVTDTPDGIQNLRRTHFKLLNAMFASPFHAIIRCTARLKGRQADNLPLVILASSSDANCGKTFAITTILKMMTGIDLEGFNKEEMNINSIRLAQHNGKGVPVFIDELDSRGYSNLKGIIKNPERCEKLNQEEQPVLVFASNDVLEPDDKDRKRIVFLRFEGSLKTNIDQNAYKGIGLDLKKKIGSGLYREYLRRMIGEVQSILDYLTYEKNIPAEWYPDLMAKSSQTLIDIFTDFGYTIPEYMAPLTWYADYSANASFVSRRTLDEIRKMYRHNRKAFTIKEDTVIIECSGDSNGKKMCQQWANTLPKEAHAKMIPTRDTSQLIVSRSELEKLLGIKLGSFLENLFR